MITRLDAKGKNIFQWGEDFVDIAALETKVYAAVLAFGRDIMRQCIEKADQLLAQQRDRGVYRDKGYRSTTLKTVMGEETVQRRIFNSDGGTWLQRNMVPGCTCQLDPFHRNKAVRTYVNDLDLQKPSWGCCTHGSPRMRLPWWRHLLKIPLTPTNRKSGASCLPTSATTNTPCCPTTSEAGKSRLCRMKVKHPHGAEAWRATSLPSLGTG